MLAFGEDMIQSKIGKMNLISKFIARPNPRFGAPRASGGYRFAIPSAETINRPDPSPKPQDSRGMSACLLHQCHGMPYEWTLGMLEREIWPGNDGWRDWRLDDTGVLG